MESMLIGSFPKPLSFPVVSEVSASKTTGMISSHINDFFLVSMHACFQFIIGAVSLLIFYFRVF